MARRTYLLSWGPAPGANFTVVGVFFCFLGFFLSVLSLFGSVHFFSRGLPKKRFPAQAK